MFINDTELSFLFILDSSLPEQANRINESKYSQLLISTITHDLKSPIATINSSLSVLNQFITREGIPYLKTAQICSQSFEYYIYDLIVLLK